MSCHPIPSLHLHIYQAICTLLPIKQHEVFLPSTSLPSSFLHPSIPILILIMHNNRPTSPNFPSTPKICKRELCQSKTKTMIIAVPFHATQRDARKHTEQNFQSIMPLNAVAPTPNFQKNAIASCQKCINQKNLKRGYKSCTTFSPFPAHTAQSIITRHATTDPTPAGYRSQSFRF